MHKNLVRPKDRGNFTVHGPLCPYVGLLRIYPSMSSCMVRAFMQPPMQGIVLETFGAGNVPSNRSDLISAWADATRRGVLIVNITQCTEVINKLLNTLLWSKNIICNSGSVYYMKP